jgi:hypothetical protein
MSKSSLPDIMMTSAISSGEEFGWPISDFETICTLALSNNLACLGGQFQWLFPDGTCEAYWLNADSAPKSKNEDWCEYVKRSNTEVLRNFQTLINSVDFDLEAKKFEFLNAKIAEGTPINNNLIFIAYFISESEHENA